MLTAPYVTAASFKAHPTFIDVLNLRSGSTDLGEQTAELTNILLMASARADAACDLGADGRLGAHSKVESLRMRPDRRGRFLFHPNHIPAVSVQSVAYGPTIGQMTTVTNPAVFVEDGRTCVVDLQGSSAAWSGALQFGPPAGGAEMYTTWAYTAGYPNTLLAAACSAGATSIQVRDATGITAGSVLRIWDPGTEEAVVVAPSYTSGTTLPLVAGLARAHGATEPTGVSGMPADVHEAVILFGCSLLQRPDSDKEDSYPSAQASPNTQSGSNPGPGFVAQAERLLKPYRRVVSV